AADHKIALVIGNGAYPTARLRNPVNDANAMASMLREVGFDVIVKTEANRRDMTRALTEFRGKLSAGSIALFYYAGHGMQVKGKNFLIPVDAEIDNEDMVATEGIDVERLFEQLKITRLNVVILDACRDNPFVRRGNSGGLAEIDAPLGTFLAYATAPGKVAADGAGANGLYTSELLKAIAIPGLKIEDVFKQVRIGVLKSSGNTQVPWESSSMTAEFYFRPDAKSAAVDVQLRRAERERIELQQEMEKLRAELIRLVSSQPPATVIATVATVAPTASPVTPPIAPIGITRKDSIEDWDKRLALVESLSGQLDYAKAIAILFDIKNDDELTSIVKFERFLKGSGWASALAMGVGPNGIPLWANASRYRTSTFAQESALEFCARLDVNAAASPEPGKSRFDCGLVIINGELRLEGIRVLAGQLKYADPAAARSAFLGTISAAVVENFTPGGQGAMGNNLGSGMQTARVYTPAISVP
ncbi:MAG: peptidase caspase catalytic subunit p20, partial [Betaproteobacteria bacterium]|nr:peptidase caspase catalytic subunit p20 [Betaproteobacteria bacterium]